VDTVAPFDGRNGTGFRFEASDGTALIWGIDQALTVYKDKKAWKTLQQNGMAQDFSWKRSAEAYVDLYKRARQRV
jgi:starch synthase